MPGSTAAVGWKDGRGSGKRAVGGDSGPSRRRQRIEARYLPKSVRVARIQRIMEKHQALKEKAKVSGFLRELRLGGTSLNSAGMQKEPRLSSSWHPYCTGGALCSGATPVAPPGCSGSGLEGNFDPLPPAGDAWGLASALHLALLLAAGGSLHLLPLTFC